MAPVQGIKDTVSSSSCRNTLNIEHCNEDMEKILRLEPTKKNSIEVIKIINRIISIAISTGPTPEQVKHIYECIWKLHKHNCKGFEANHVYLYKTDTDARAKFTQLLVDYMKMEGTVITTYNKDADYCNNLKKQILDLLYDVCSKLKSPASNPKDIWKRSLDILKILPIALPEIFNEIVATVKTNCIILSEEHTKKSERNVKEDTIIVLDDDDNNDNKDLIQIQISSYNKNCTRQKDLIHDTGQQWDWSNHKEKDAIYLNKVKQVIDINVVRNTNNFKSILSKKRKKEKVQNINKINTDCVPNIKNSLIINYLQKQTKCEETVHILDNRKIKDFIINKKIKSENKSSSSISPASSSSCSSLFSSSHSTYIGTNSLVNKSSISVNNSEKDNVVARVVNNNNSNNNLAITNRDVKVMYNKTKSKSDELKTNNCVRETEDIYKKIQEFVKSGSTQMIIKKCESSGNILILPADDANQVPSITSIPEKSSQPETTTKQTNSTITSDNECDEDLVNDLSTTTSSSITQELAQIQKPNNQQQEQVSQLSVIDDHEKFKNDSQATISSSSTETLDDQHHHVIPNVSNSIDNSICTDKEKQLPQAHIENNQSCSSPIKTNQLSKEVCSFQKQSKVTEIPQCKRAQCMAIVPYIPPLLPPEPPPQEVVVVLSYGRQIYNTMEDINKLPNINISEEIVTNPNNEQDICEESSVESNRPTDSIEIESPNVTQSHDLNGDNTKTDSSCETHNIQAALVEDNLDHLECVTEQESSVQNKCQNQETTVDDDDVRNTTLEETSDNIIDQQGSCIQEHSIESSPEKIDKDADNVIRELEELLQRPNLSEPLPMLSSVKENDNKKVIEDADIVNTAERNTEKITNHQFIPEKEIKEIENSRIEKSENKSESNVSTETIESSFELSPKSKKVIEDFLDKDESFPRDSEQQQIASTSVNNLVPDKSHSFIDKLEKICEKFIAANNCIRLPLLTPDNEFKNYEIDKVLSCGGSPAEENKSGSNTKITLRTSEILDGYELEIVATKSEDSFHQFSSCQVDDLNENYSVNTKNEEIEIDTKNYDTSPLVNKSPSDSEEVNNIKSILLDLIDKVEETLGNFILSEKIGNDSIPHIVGEKVDEHKPSPDNLYPLQSTDTVTKHSVIFSNCNKDVQDLNKNSMVDNGKNITIEKCDIENEENEMENAINERPNSINAGGSEVSVKNKENTSIIGEDVRLPANSLLMKKQRKNGEIPFYHMLPPATNIVNVTNIPAVSNFAILTTGVAIDNYIAQDIQKPQEQKHENTWNKIEGVSGKNPFVLTEKDFNMSSSTQTSTTTNNVSHMIENKQSDTNFLTTYYYEALYQQDPYYTNILPPKPDKMFNSTIVNGCDEIHVLADAASKCKKLPLANSNSCKNMPDPNSFKNIPQRYETSNIYDHAKKLDQENSSIFSRSKTSDCSDSEDRLFIDDDPSENAVADNRYLSDGNDAVAVGANKLNSTVNTSNDRFAKRLLTNRRDFGIIKRGKSIKRSQKLQNDSLPKASTSYLPSFNDYIDIDNRVVSTNPTYPKLPRLKNKNKKIKPLNSNYDLYKRTNHDIDDPDDIPLADRLKRLVPEPTKYKQQTKHKEQKRRSKNSTNSSPGKIRTEYVSKLRSRSTSNDYINCSGGSIVMDPTSLKSFERPSYRSDLSHEEPPLDTALRLKEPVKEKHLNSEMLTPEINSDLTTGKCSNRRKGSKPKKISNRMEKERIDNADYVNRSLPIKNAFKPKILKRNKLSTKTVLIQHNDSIKKLSDDNDLLTKHNMDNSTSSRTMISPPKTPKERCKQAFKEQQINNIISPISSKYAENTLPPKLRRKHDLSLHCNTNNSTPQTDLFLNCKNTASKLIGKLKERLQSTEYNSDDVKPLSPIPPLKITQTTVDYSDDFLQNSSKIFSKHDNVYSDNHNVYGKDFFLEEQTQKLSNCPFSQSINQLNEIIIPATATNHCAQLVEEAIKNFKEYPSLENQQMPEADNDSSNHSTISVPSPTDTLHADNQNEQHESENIFWEENVALEVSVSSSNDDISGNSVKNNLESEATETIIGRHNEIAENLAITADSPTNNLTTEVIVNKGRDDFDYDFVDGASVRMNQEQDLKRQTFRQYLFSIQQKLELEKTDETIEETDRNINRQTVLKFGKASVESNVENVILDVKSFLNAERENSYIETDFKKTNRHCSKPSVIENDTNLEIDNGMENQLVSEETNTETPSEGQEIVTSIDSIESQIRSKSSVSSIVTTDSLTSAVEDLASQNGDPSRPESIRKEIGEEKQINFANCEKIELNDNEVDNTAQTKPSIPIESIQPNANYFHEKLITENELLIKQSNFENVKPKLQTDNIQLEQKSLVIIQLDAQQVEQNLKSPAPQSPTNDHHTSAITSTDHKEKLFGKTASAVVSESEISTVQQCATKSDQSEQLQNLEEQQINEIEPLALGKEDDQLPDDLDIQEKIVKENEENVFDIEEKSLNIDGQKDEEGLASSLSEENSKGTLQNHTVKDNDYKNNELALETLVNVEDVPNVDKNEIKEQVEINRNEEENIDKIQNEESVEEHNEIIDNNEERTECVQSNQPSKKVDDILNKNEPDLSKISSEIIKFTDEPGENVDDSKSAKFSINKETVIRKEILEQSVYVLLERSVICNSETNQETVSKTDPIYEYRSPINMFKYSRRRSGEKYRNRFDFNCEKSRKRKPKGIAKIQTIRSMVAERQTDKNIDVLINETRRHFESLQMHTDETKTNTYDNNLFLEAERKNHLDDCLFRKTENDANHIAEEISDDPNSKKGNLQEASQIIKHKESVVVNNNEQPALPKEKNVINWLIDDSKTENKDKTIEKNDICNVQSTSSSSDHTVSDTINEVINQEKSKDKQDKFKDDAKVEDTSMEKHPETFRGKEIISDSTTTTTVMQPQCVYKINVATENKLPHRRKNPTPKSLDMRKSKNTGKLPCDSGKSEIVQEKIEREQMVEKDVSLTIIDCDKLDVKNSATNNQVKGDRKNTQKIDSILSSDTNPTPNEIDQCKNKTEKTIKIGECTTERKVKVEPDETNLKTIDLLKGDIKINKTSGTATKPRKQSTKKINNSEGSKDISINLNSTNNSSNTKVVELPTVVLSVKKNSKLIVDNIAVKTDKQNDIEKTSSNEPADIVKSVKDEKKSIRKNSNAKHSNEPQKISKKIQEKSGNELINKEISRDTVREKNKQDTDKTKTKPNQTNKNDSEHIKIKENQKKIESSELKKEANVEVKIIKDKSVKFTAATTVIPINSPRRKSAFEKEDQSYASSIPNIKQASSSLSVNDYHRKIKKKLKKIERKTANDMLDIKSDKIDSAMETKSAKSIDTDTLSEEKTIKQQKQTTVTDDKTLGNCQIANSVSKGTAELIFNGQQPSSSNRTESKVSKVNKHSVDKSVEPVKDKKNNIKRTKKDSKTKSQKSSEIEQIDVNRKRPKSNKKQIVVSNDEHEAIKLKEETKCGTLGETQNTSTELAVIEECQKKSDKKLIGKSEKPKLASAITKFELDETNLKTHDSKDQNTKRTSSVDKNNKSKSEKSDTKGSERGKKSHEKSVVGSSSPLESESKKNIHQTKSNITKTVETGHSSKFNKETVKKSPATIVEDSRNKENRKTEQTNSAPSKQIEEHNNDTSNKSSKHRQSEKSHKRKTSRDNEEVNESKRKRTKNQECEKKKIRKNDHISEVNLLIEENKVKTLRKEKRTSISTTIEYVINYLDSENIEKHDDQPEKILHETSKSEIVSLTPDQSSMEQNLKKEEKSNHKKRSRNDTELNEIPNKIPKLSSKNDSILMETDVKIETISIKSTKNKDTAIINHSAQVADNVKESTVENVNSKKLSTQDSNQECLVTESLKEFDEVVNRDNVNQTNKKKGMTLKKNKKMDTNKRRRIKRHHKDNADDVIKEKKHCKYIEQNETVDKSATVKNEEKIEKNDDATPYNEHIPEITEKEVVTKEGVPLPNFNLKPLINSVAINTDTKVTNEDEKYLNIHQTEPAIFNHLDQSRVSIPEVKNDIKTEEKSIKKTEAIESQPPAAPEIAFYDHYDQTNPTEIINNANCQDNSNAIVNNVPNDRIQLNNVDPRSIAAESEMLAPSLPLQSSIFYQQSEPNEISNNMNVDSDNSNDSEKNFISKEAFNTLLNFEDVNELANKTEEEIKNSDSLLRIPQIVPPTSTVDEMVEHFTTTAVTTMVKDAIIDAVVIPAAVPTVSEPNLNESCAMQAAYKSFTVNAQELELLNFDSDPQRPSVLPDFFDHRDDFIHEDKSSSNTVSSNGSVPSRNNLQMSNGSFFNDKQLYAGGESDLRASVMSESFTSVTPYVTTSCAVTSDKIVIPTTIDSFYNNKNDHHTQFGHIGQANPYGNINETLSDSFYDQYMSTVNTSSAVYETNVQAKMSTCSINNIEMNLLGGFLDDKAQEHHYQQHQKSELILNDQQTKETDVSLQSQYDKLLQNVNNGKQPLASKSDGSGSGSDSSGDHTYTRNPFLPMVHRTIDEQNHLKPVTIERPATEFSLDVMDLSFIDPGSTSTDILGSTTGSWSFDNRVSDPIEGLPAWDDSDEKSMPVPTAVERLSTTQNHSNGAVIDDSVSNIRSSTSSSGSTSNANDYRKVVVERQPHSRYSDFDPYAYSYTNSLSLTSVSSCKYTTVNDVSEDASALEKRKSFEIANISKVAKLIEKQLPKDLVEKGKAPSSSAVGKPSPPISLPRKEVKKTKTPNQRQTDNKPKTNDILTIPTRRKVIVTSKITNRSETQTKEKKQTVSDDHKELLKQKDDTVSNTEDPIKSPVKDNTTKNMPYEHSSWQVTPETQVAYINSIKKSFEEEVIGQSTLSEVKTSPSIVDFPKKLTATTPTTTTTRRSEKYPKTIQITSNILIAPPLRQSTKSLSSSKIVVRSTTQPLLVDQSTKSPTRDRRSKTSEPSVTLPTKQTTTILKCPEKSSLPQRELHAHIPSQLQTRGNYLVNKSLASDLINKSNGDLIGQNITKKNHTLNTTGSSSNVKYQVQKYAGSSPSPSVKSLSSSSSPGGGYDQRMQRINRKPIKPSNELKSAHDKSPAQHNVYSPRMDNPSKSRNNYDLIVPKAGTGTYRMKDETKRIEKSPNLPMEPRNNSGQYYYAISPRNTDSAATSNNISTQNKSHKSSPTPSINTTKRNKFNEGSKKSPSLSKSVSLPSSSSSIVSTSSSTTSTCPNTRPIAKVKPFATGNSVVQSNQKRNQKRGCISTELPLSSEICETRTKTREMEIAIKESKRTESTDDMNATFDKLYEKGPTNPNFSTNKFSSNGQLMSADSTSKQSHDNNTKIINNSSPGTSSIRSAKQQQQESSHKTSSKSDLNDKVREDSHSSNNHKRQQHHPIEYPIFQPNNNPDYEWWKVVESRAPRGTLEMPPIFSNKRSK